MILYRPVSLRELELIYDSGMKGFPARLPKQPIFYPVLQLEFARQTALKWNAKSGESAGYVTQFKVEDAYINKLERHAVGKSQFEEYWIAAEDLEEFNRQIVGPIKVLEAYFGDSFQGFVPDAFGLQGKDAVEQFTLLANSYIYKRMDFYLELKRNHKTVFLNYPFWQQHDFENPGLKEKVIKAIREAWFTSFPQVPLAKPIDVDVASEDQANGDPSPDDTPPAKPAKSTREEPRKTQSDLDRTVKPVRKDNAPVQRPDFRPAAKPPREEVNRPKHMDRDRSPTPPEEDVPPVKRPEPRPIVKPIREEPPRVQRPAPKPPADSLPEDREPKKQDGAARFVPPAPEARPPVRPESYARVSPVHEERTTPEQPAAPSSKEPTHAETNLAEQADLHFKKGIELGLNGGYQEAIDELSSAIEVDPGHALAQSSLGVAFHRVGEDDRALACYEAALALDPHAAEPHYFRANILYEQGNSRQAIAEYTIAIGLDPALIVAHEGPIPQDRLTDYTSTPAEMYRIARPAHRILALDQSIQADPRQANLFKERADAYYRLQNFEATVADYTSALSLDPQDADALHFRGRAYEQMGQQEKALQDYRRAISLHPQLADAYLERGTELGRTGNLQQSITSLSEGIRLAPQNPAGFFNRGMSYFQIGDLEGAIADFSQVIQISPGDEDAYYWRGVSHEQAGHQSDAISDYKHYLTIAQNPQAREDVVQRLRQWETQTQDSPRKRKFFPDLLQKTKPSEAEQASPVLDLHGLLTALGERALRSTWFGSGVECYGRKAEELYRFTDQNRPIDGQELLTIAAGIRRTITGDFQAFDADASSPWIFIRAWDGTGFYIESNDPQLLEHLKSQGLAPEEVEGASPPYESLFLHIA